MTVLGSDTVVGIVGAGAMGGGIAQVAAQAGHRVLLFDTASGAAARAVERIDAGLARLVARGRMDGEARADVVAAIEPVDSLDALAPAGLVVEAVVERIDVKQDLFVRLEALVRADAILATNTSSLSVTAIASALEHPGRCAGFHFFNPAPIMRLVEVVRGAATEPKVVETLAGTARAWGKVAVTCSSTPGFIVNRVARPFYGEALRLLEERATDPETLDAIVTEAGGFRMGPCTLMDLIGHDVNYAVTCSVFDAYSQDPRYRPSLVQKELVDAGWLGRKTGRGFHVYGDDAPEKPGGAAEAAGSRLALDGATRRIGAVMLARTDGRTAAARALADGTPVVLYDLVADPLASNRVAVSASPDVGGNAMAEVVAALEAGGRRASVIADRPGLVVMRTAAMLANEAYEAQLTGVAGLDEIDQAMLHGVNYPKGPAAWARELGLGAVLAVLDNIHAATGDPRYRASLGLRLAADEARLRERAGDRGISNATETR